MEETIIRKEVRGALCRGKTQQVELNRFYSQFYFLADQLIATSVNRLNIYLCKRS